MLREIWDAFLNLAFPPICILCKKYLPPADRLLQLCTDCLADIEINRPPFCRKCSRPLKDFDTLLCRTCTAHLPEFDRAWAPLVYNDTCQKLIHLFKYSGKTGLRRYFTNVIVERLSLGSLTGASFDMVVPIPLHSTRQRERGYNQAAIIAKALAASLGLPLVPQALVRVRPTTTQTALRQKERWTNICGAFKINHPALVSEKNIILVDDLLTSGATACAAAELLKNSGAKNVSVFTLAIARLEKEF